MSFLALCVLNSFLSCTAFLFNIVTINAIKKTSSLSKTLKTLLLTLAISNLGVGLLAQPIYVTQLIMKWKQHTENDSFYIGISNAHLILTNIFAPVTFYVLAVLCVERFMHGHSSTPQIPRTCDTQAHCHCGNLNLGSKRTFLTAEVMDAEDGHVWIFCFVCVSLLYGCHLV